MLRQQMAMATLSDLVKAVSAVTRLPEATVFAYGRFARQAGLIQQKGRGRSAASMSIVDAANLLIAVAATGVTKDAGRVVETFRSLRNGHFYNFMGEGDVRLVSAAGDWLRKTGMGQPHDLNGFRIPGTFGSFFEFFIESILNGELANIFKLIPVAEIPDDLWRSWKRGENPHLKESMDELVAKGLVKPKNPAELVFGEDINLEVKFSRLVPAVEIEFLRMWDNSPQVVFSIMFGPERGAQSRGAHDMRLIATYTQHILAGVGLVQANMVRAAAVRSYKPMDSLFASQFDRAKSDSSGERADAKRG
jgi:hypothetical protein